MSKVYVVGIGPGGPEQITPQARAAMDRAEVLCGYTVYLELVKGLYPDKEIYTTPMRQELERCRWALETAQSGRTVALLCSGDPGVYGMAGPLLELAQSFPEVEVEIVPGVTAALSGGALLGAPLGHDFCVVSLSDLLTSWEVIERRLECAAQGDFALLQPRVQKTGGLFETGLRHPFAIQKSGDSLRLGAEHRPGGAGVQNS